MDLGQAIIDLTTRARYGVSPEEKDLLVYGRKLPGAPARGTNPAPAERYASTYLGSQEWGSAIPQLFNQIAFSNFIDTDQLPKISLVPSAEREARINAGKAGIAAYQDPYVGNQASPNEELSASDKLRQAIERMFVPR